MKRSMPLLALALLAATATPAQAGRHRPLPPPATAFVPHQVPALTLPPQATATPSLTTAVLYADLSGIIAFGMPRPDPAPEPMWLANLTQRTRTLYDQLAELDAEAGQTSIDFDWLCQCRNTRHLLPKANIVVEHQSPERAQLRVGLRFLNSGRDTVFLEMVYEDGWKIDDIIDANGHHYSDAMQQAVADRLRSRPVLRGSPRP